MITIDTYEGNKIPNEWYERKKVCPEGLELIDYEDGIYKATDNRFDSYNDGDIVDIPYGTMTLHFRVEKSFIEEPAN